VESALSRKPPGRNWLLPIQCIPTDPPIVRLGQTAEQAQQDFWQVRTYRVQRGSVQPVQQFTGEPARDAHGGKIHEPESLTAPPRPGTIAPFSHQEDTGRTGFLLLHVRRRSGRIVGATLAGPWAHELADLVAFLIQQKIPLPDWNVPTGCVSPAMGLLEEAARLAREDHRPRWWDLPLENLQRLWQKWKDRSSAVRQAPASDRSQAEQK